MPVGSAAHRFLLVFKTLALLAFIAAFLPAMVAAPQEKTLTRNDVVSLLGGGGHWRGHSTGSTRSAGEVRVIG